MATPTATATAGNNSDRNPSPHILVFPYPAQGHMLPLLDLAHHLCLRGITVSILVTPKNLPYISSLISAHPTTASAVVFPFPSHPSLPAGVENVKDVGISGTLPLNASLRQLEDKIVDWFESNPNPPRAIVSDFFLGWTNDLARRIDVPRFAFFSSGAFVASVLDFCWNNAELFASSNDPFRFSDLPRSPIFREEHLPSVFRRYTRSPSASELVKDSMKVNLESYGCIFNSFLHLEAEYFEYLTRKTGHDRIFAVGPLSLTGFDASSRGSGGSNSDPDLDPNIITWLDGCPDGCVLYVCFGSQKTMKKDQTEALALALETSMTRFIWVVKESDPIPDGFENRVSGRGVIIRKWAPQVVLLGHRAVGGFLSHCGWNSVLEAVSVGVMILAWPMEADQFVNARILVEHMGVSVRVSEGGETVPDPSDLGRRITEAMGHGGLEVRIKAAEMADLALAAVRPGGSSNTDLDRLVKQLCLL